MRRLLFGVGLAALVGCGASAVDAARAGLTTAAYAAVQADRAFAEGYAIASEAARDASETQEEKDARMARWERAADEVERLVSGLYAGLAGAEIALDAWEQTGDSGEWDEALACLVTKMRELERVLAERGVTIPAALAKVLALGEGLACAGP